MLKSYKFDSRPVPVQEVEQNPAKVPFEISEPPGDEISLSKPASFALKIKTRDEGDPLPAGGMDGGSGG